MSTSELLLHDAANEHGIPPRHLLAVTMHGLKCLSSKDQRVLPGVIKLPRKLELFEGYVKAQLAGGSACKAGNEEIVRDRRENFACEVVRAYSIIDPSNPVVEIKKKDCAPAVLTNQLLWKGLTGGLPYPTVRSGRGFSGDCSAVPKFADPLPVLMAAKLNVLCERSYVRPGMNSSNPSER